MFIWLLWRENLKNLLYFLNKTLGNLFKIPTNFCTKPSFLIPCKSDPFKNLQLDTNSHVKAKNAFCLIAKTKCKPCTTFHRWHFVPFLSSLGFCIFEKWKRQGKENYETHVRLAVGYRFGALQIFLLMHHYGVINIVSKKEVGNVYGFVLRFWSFNLNWSR